LEQSKDELMKELFAHFVREMMIREYIVFNFLEEDGTIPDYVARVFVAANFLQNKAEEEQLVARDLMNLHPTVLAHSAFSERPRTRKELINALGLIEGVFSLLRERVKTHQTTPLVCNARACPATFSVLRENMNTQNTTPTSNGSSTRGLETPLFDPLLSRLYSCSTLGQTRQMMSDYLQRPSRSGNGQVPRQSVGPCTDNVSALLKVAATFPSPLLWIVLNLKIGTIVALVDTGGKFTCVRSDVMDYLYQRSERRTFLLLVMFVG